MLGPGEYMPEATEGITRIEDLPLPIIVPRSRNYRNRPCPQCGRSAYRLKTDTRTLHDLGDVLAGRPRELHVSYSAHRCLGCNTYFNADMTDLAPPKAKYTHAVIDLAVRLVTRYGLPFEAACHNLWFEHRVFVPAATIQNWVAAAEKKGGPRDHRAVPERGPRGVLGLHRRR